MPEPEAPKPAPIGNRFYAELKAFSSSSLFFIFLGCVFLFAAGRVIDRTHPSFVFLLAILGLSIVLYGTGTQGAGEAVFKDVPVKVFVAGGAGVLAAIFGFGILWKAEEIQKVFSRKVNYGVVELQIQSLFNPRTQLHITATSGDDKTLPFIAKRDKIAIFAPTTASSERIKVCVEVLNSDLQSMTSPNPCQDLKWEIFHDNDYGEPVTHIAKGTLPMVLPATLPLPGQ